MWGRKGSQCDPTLFWVFFDSKLGLDFPDPNIVYLSGRKKFSDALCGRGRGFKKVGSHEILHGQVRVKNEFF